MRRQASIADAGGKTSLALVSLGCAKNAADLEVMAGNLLSKGYVLSPDPDRADVAIVNTCSFIASAREEAEAEIARALRLIRDREAFFHVRADRYITCGFSAGGYLVCLWNTGKGYPAFGRPKPQAVFPIYPFVSPSLDLAGDQPETDTEQDLKEDL